MVVEKAEYPKISLLHSHDVLWCLLFAPVDAPRVLSRNRPGFCWSLMLTALLPTLCSRTSVLPLPIGNYGHLIPSRTSGPPCVDRVYFPWRTRNACWPCDADGYENISSPVSSTVLFIPHPHSCKQHPSFVSAATLFIEFLNVLCPRNAAPPQTFGALNNMAALGPFVTRYPEVKGSLEDFVIHHVSRLYFQRTICARHREPGFDSPFYCSWMAYAYEVLGTVVRIVVWESGMAFSSTMGSHDGPVLLYGRRYHLELAKSFDMRPFFIIMKNETLILLQILIFSTTRWNPWWSSSRVSSFRSRHGWRTHWWVFHGLVAARRFTDTGTSMRCICRRRAKLAWIGWVTCCLTPTRTRSGVMDVAKTVAW